MSPSMCRILRDVVYDMQEGSRNIFLSYTTRMNELDRRVRWENRTGQKVVPIRLSEGYREKLERLAARHGGRRQAIEAAIDALLKQKDDIE